MSRERFCVERAICCRGGSAVTATAPQAKSVSQFSDPLIALALILLAAVLVIGLVLSRRDRTIKRTRFGFFVERIRHDDDDRPDE